jgi:hypothetical protein
MDYWNAVLSEIDSPRGPIILFFAYVVISYLIQLFGSKAPSSIPIGFTLAAYAFGMHFEFNTFHQYLWVGGIFLGIIRMEREVRPVRES